MESFLSFSDSQICTPEGKPIRLPVMATAVNPNIEFMEELWSGCTRGAKVIDLEHSKCQTLHTFVPSIKPLFLHSGMTQRHGTKRQILEPS